jgi:hypothetical protein
MSMRPTLPGRCGHVAPMTLERLESSYVARCLRCGTAGPARDTSTEARRALLEQGQRYRRKAPGAN